MSDQLIEYLIAKQTVYLLSAMVLAASFTWPHQLLLLKTDSAESKKLYLCFNWSAQYVLLRKQFKKTHYVCRTIIYFFLFECYKTLLYYNCFFNRYIRIINSSWYAVAVSNWLLYKVDINKIS